ncbi:maleylpyruvate isomerase family mycothiol-dependent enzyme [Actinoplanes sp. NPDC049668]|uniref:maleylpyruvate isomerase family mycothiol-dependent enzyme n=1 Tax=unclassified Actinoplanes TaxID=2626549 RepID=UPI0033AC031D
MQRTLDFTDLLALLDERSAAMRAAIASAPSLDLPVPTCPEWTLFDLAEHLGRGRRKWAAVVAAGPADAPCAEFAARGAEPAPRDREALLAWLDASVRELATALREAGPDGGCWTWWDRSESPQTAGAVARHQVQEVAVHTYDVQAALGAPRPLPDEVALDGIGDFLTTCCAGDYRWPYEPATIAYHATEGDSWGVSLAADGVTSTRRPADADVSVWGTASELVLFFYNRVPMESLKLEGDRRHLDRVIAWDPDE